MNQYFNLTNPWRASKATPAFSLHGICKPITCNVGLHTTAIQGPTKPIYKWFSVVDSQYLDEYY